MYIIRLVFTFLILLSNLNAIATDRILIISSYGTDYKWSNDIMDAISIEVKNSYPEIEITREFLSSELSGNVHHWGDNMNMILNNYQNSKPLAIVLVSDEAWMAYRDVSINNLKDVPLVLCGVKPHTISVADYIAKRDTLQLSDYSSTKMVMKEHNATGVLREMNTFGYLSLIQELIPKLDHFLFITDSRVYGIYTRLLLERQIKKDFPNMPVKYIDGRYISTDSMFSILPGVSPTTGVLLTSWLTGERGFESSKDYIYSQMESKLKTPIFITNDIGVEKEYFIGGYFNHASFWGKKTADILIQIIEGKKSVEIPTVSFHDSQCFIGWNIMTKYKVNRDYLPINAIIVNAPNSFWASYKYYIISGIIAFGIFCLFYLYTLRSNIKLQHARKLLMKSVEETNHTNEKLETTQKELIVALHKAKESDRLKSAFLANMSHEIRTPLNAIVGFAWLMGDVESEEERNEYADIIQRNSDLLLQLLSDILDLSRIEAGVLEFKLKETNVYEVCSNVVTSLQNKCKIDVKLICNQSGDTSLQISTDPNRLMQVLVNLTNNAIKFTSKGKIEIGYNDIDNDYVEFYVSDTGIGISEEKCDAIFERFTKLNNYVEGTGLGLSICKTIVETLEGQIGVESKPGNGSRFWFKIKKNPTINK